MVEVVELTRAKIALKLVDGRGRVLVLGHAVIEIGARVGVVESVALVVRQQVIRAPISITA